jgi:serine/threonine protein kinase
MSPELYQRVRKLFDEALDLPNDERAGFLKVACAEDTEILQSVTRLLNAHDRADSFLNGGAVRPQQIGRYVITGELGRGAMGIVYEAVDPLIGRKIALKVVHCQALGDAGSAGVLRERLLREVRSAGSLLHPGIVIVFDVGLEGDIAFFAMERVDGPSLQQLMNSGRNIEPPQALDIVRQTAAALDYAHHHGVVHRDVKPANIMLDRGTKVKVADFSIAKITSETKTATGMIRGTPSYMSPEQIEALPLDGRSDQFSLGVVAFELLTGVRPFQADSVAALAHRIVYGPRPLARTANPALFEAVERVFSRVLSRAPAARYGNCEEFAAALTTAAESGRIVVGSEPAVAVKRTGNTRRRYLVVAAVIVPLLALALVLYQFLRHGHNSPEVRADLHPIETIVQPAIVPSRVPDATADGDAKEEKNQDPPVLTSRAASARQIYEEAIAHRDIVLLRKAADMGESRAMVGLGEIYLENHDPGEAVKWFRRAADAGDAAGMLYMGGMYDLGEGGPQSDEAAVYWYRQAYNAGDPHAMFNLGKMYENGRGVPKDRDRARELYRQGAERGDQEASNAFARLSR